MPKSENDRRIDYIEMGVGRHRTRTVYAGQSGVRPE